MSRCRALLGTVAAIAVLAIAAGPAGAHGGEEEALEKTPARALAQQALALLSQENSAVEAHERVEAALESEDRAGVDAGKLRETQRAFDEGDHERAARLLDEALANEDAPSVKSGMPSEHDEPGAEDPAASSADPQPSSFEHAREFEPDRATAEWVAIAIGLLALVVAGAGLMRTRRDRVV